MRVRYLRQGKGGQTALLKNLHDPETDHAISHAGGGVRTAGAA
jgi:hypothetical protein